MQYWHVPLRVHTRVLHTDLNAPELLFLCGISAPPPLPRSHFSTRPTDPVSTHSHNVLQSLLMEQRLSAVPPFPENGFP